MIQHVLTNPVTGDYAMIHHPPFRQKDRYDLAQEKTNKWASLIALVIIAAFIVLLIFTGGCELSRMKAESAGLELDKNVIIATANESGMLSANAQADLMTIDDRISEIATDISEATDWWDLGDRTVPKLVQIFGLPGAGVTLGWQIFSLIGRRRFGRLVTNLNAATMTSDGDNIVLNKSILKSLNLATGLEAAIDKARTNENIRVALE